MGIETPNNAENNNEQEKVKNHFGHSFEITRIEEGDEIPVGGESIYSDDVNIKVVGNFEAFDTFFADAHDKSETYDLPKLKEWLDSQNISIDEGLFASLFAFTKAFEEAYPKKPNDKIVREEMYRKNEEGVKLSEIFDESIPECGEIAALAQFYLQKENIPSSYFSGDVLWDKEHEHSDEHSFIVIRLGEQTYIFDPTNPTKTDQGEYPSIYTTEMDFDSEMSQKSKKFVTSKNVLDTTKEVFFGVNDGTNIKSERDIV